MTSAHSKLGLPPSDNESLAYGREIPLANLGIVPQNIIFSTTDTLASRLPSRLHQTDAWPRRWNGSEGSRPGSSLDLTRPGGGRSVSGSSTADALRRRLALGSHSASSLHSNLASASPRPSTTARASSGTFPASPASAVSGLGSSSGASASTSSGQLAHSSATIRPASSSVIGSDTNAPPRSKVNMHGVEVSRVAAAIGADTTTALGLMTTESKQDTESVSGMSNQVPGVVESASHGRNGGRRFTSTYGRLGSSTRCLVRLLTLEQRAMIPASSNCSTESILTTTENLCLSSALMYRPRYLADALRDPLILASVYTNDQKAF